MSRRSSQYSPWFALGLALVLALGALVGCSTPQERYKTLSIFFDGVPNPDAPRPVAQAAESDGSKQVITASVVSRHKPYGERKCGVCHTSAGGEIQEFEKAYDACVKCHKKVTTAYPRMHGPVARGDCNFCHVGHESNYPALLKDAPAKVCTNCHDNAILSPIPQHVTVPVNCIQCHYGHGGNAPGFLKPSPASQPATAPATQAATRPAPECPNLATAAEWAAKEHTP